MKYKKKHWPRTVLITLNNYQVYISVICWYAIDLTEVFLLFYLTIKCDNMSINFGFDLYY